MIKLSTVQPLQAETKSTRGEFLPQTSGFSREFTDKRHETLLIKRVTLVKTPHSNSLCERMKQQEMDLTVVKSNSIDVWRKGTNC